MVLRNAITAFSSATSVQTANNLPCSWCGEGHLLKECPKRGNTSSTPTCCNCRLAEGDNPHSENYRGCRHANDESQKKSQRTPKTTTGWSFSSKLATPGMSFAVALRGKTEEQQQPQTHQVAGHAKMEPRVPVALLNKNSRKQVSQFGLQM
jgi:hypothetical protein